MGVSKGVSKGVSRESVDRGSVFCRNHAKCLINFLSHKLDVISPRQFFIKYTHIYYFQIENPELTNQSALFALVML